tara:strand:+ start:3660 stop:3866 length:207 start_codon:yes stop_codon:yes gene_type:complete
MTLKEKMKQKEITVEFLSKVLGLSRPTLFKYLKKPDEFRVKHARVISRYLEVTERYALINYFKSESYE